MVDDVDNLPAHTKLSASSAERWMKCPGSVYIYDYLKLYEEERPSSPYAEEGTAAHELCSRCLTSNSDAWEHMGGLVRREDLGDDLFKDHIVDADMADAVQIYLDHVRDTTKGFDIIKVETRIDNPDIHPHFGGTADLYALNPTTLKVKDFKYGIGIPVDIVGNEQMMYYGYGVLKSLTSLQLSKIDTVELTIIQPRAFHPDGSTRTVILPTEWVLDWGDNFLVPAMHVAEEPEGDLLPGEWCRFCPAIVDCPLMQGMAKAAASATSKDPKLMDNQQLGLELQHGEVAKMYIKSLGDEATFRMKKGQKVPGHKMVKQKSNRVFKGGAERELLRHYGASIYVPQKLKTPAVIDKMVGGKKITAQWAFKPDTGLTRAKASDKKAEVIVRPATEKFKNIGKVEKE